MVLKEGINSLDCAENAEKIFYNARIGGILDGVVGLGCQLKSTKFPRMQRTCTFGRLVHSRSPEKA